MSENVKQEGDFKMKKKSRKPKQLSKKDDVVKVTVDSAPVDEVKEEDIPKVTITEPKTKEAEDAKVELKEVVEEVVEEAVEEASDEEVQIVQIEEEDTDEQIQELGEQAVEATARGEELGIQIPENIEKVIEFMNETGGTLEDYVRLNSDYSDVNESVLLKEYYKQSKPHLDSDDIEILMDDFEYDEDIDEDKDIRKKKLAFKEEVAKAKGFLEDLKGKYYDEIKLRPGTTQKQQEAVDFFNRYNEEQSTIQKRRDVFQSKTNSFFSEDFKGFDFSLGDKKFRYGLKDTSKVANTQSDLNNFVGKFLNEKGEIADYNGYHKAMYVAGNADKVINHFYEQGKADAIKDITAKSKNINAAPRQVAPSGEFVNGVRIKSVSGESPSKLRIKKIKL